ncbi:unnamed protein product, partial [Rotaria sp. Silwood2]
MVFVFFIIDNLSCLDTIANFSKFQSFSLHTLYITSTDSNIISLVLQACSHLFSFHVTVLYQNRHILPPSSSSSSYNHLLEEFLNNLYHKLSFDTIHILFLYIPNIKY